MKNKTFIGTQILGFWFNRQSEPDMMQVASMAEELCNFCGEDPEAEMSINFVRVTKGRKEKGNQVPAPGSVLLFSCKCGKQWGLTPEHLNKLKDLYSPTLDVLHNCRRLAEWCENNPHKRKLFSSMDKWVSYCLNKNYEKAKAEASQSTRPTTDPRYADR